MTWLWLTLLAITARSLLSVATKHMTNVAKVSSMTQTVLFMSGAGVFSLFLIPFFGDLTLHGLDNLWWVAVVMVLSQALGNILFFKGVSLLDASVSSVAFSSTLIWGVPLSIVFLNSSFSVVQLVGVVLLFVAIILAQYRGKIRQLDPAVLYVVASTLLFAVFQVTTAAMSRHVSTATYLVMAYVGTATIVGLVYWRKVRSDIRSIRQHRRHVALATFYASALSLTFFVFLYLAFRHAPDRGEVVVLQTGQVILSVIFAILIFRERERVPQKVGAAVLAVLASYLIVR